MECGMKLDAQVDMILFKEYGEIDLDETPVIALDCGHFFTTETLDGTYGRHVLVYVSFFEGILE